MELRIDSAADQSIIAALRNGERREAAGLMVRYYANAVLNLCAAQVEELERAEDLTHECFRQAFATMDAFGGELSVRNWLVYTSRQVCLEQLQREAADAPPPPDMLNTVRLSGDDDRLRVSDSLRRRLEVLAAAL